jgi:hypothetical protein
LAWGIECCYWLALFESRGALHADSGVAILVGRPPSSIFAETSCLVGMPRGEWASITKIMGESIYKPSYKAFSF